MDHLRIFTDHKWFNLRLTPNLPAMIYKFTPGHCDITAGCSGSSSIEGAASSSSVKNHILLAQLAALTCNGRRHGLFAWLFALSCLALVSLIPDD